MSEPNIAFIDGSSVSMYGYYLLPQKETFICKDHPVTNNVAEWLALYSLILDLPHGWIGIVYSDSLLVVDQFQGLYKIKNEELQRINNACKALKYQKHLVFEIMWIPREKNIFGKKLEKELEKDRKKRWQIRNHQNE